MVVLQILSLALLAIGALLSLRTWHAERRLRDSRFWPTTRGEIVDSDLTVETFRDAGGRAITLYGAMVHYRFQLGRTFHESTRVKWADEIRSADPKRHRALIARYPAGRIVQVHYDPRAPGSAVLEPGGRVAMQLAWMLGLGFLMLGTAGVIAATVHP